MTKNSQPMIVAEDFVEQVVESSSGFFYRLLLGHHHDDSDPQYAGPEPAHFSVESSRRFTTREEAEKPFIHLPRPGGLTFCGIDMDGWPVKDCYTRVQHEATCPSCIHEADKIRRENQQQEALNGESHSLVFVDRYDIPYVGLDAFFIPDKEISEKEHHDLRHVQGMCFPEGMIEFSDSGDGPEICAMQLSVARKLYGECECNHDTAKSQAGVVWADEGFTDEALEHATSDSPEPKWNPYYYRIHHYPDEEMMSDIGELFTNHVVSHIYYFSTR